MAGVGQGGVGELDVTDVPDPECGPGDVVVRVGEPPKPPREPTDEEAGEGEEPEPEAGPDPDALVPLTFELPADPVEPVEEPAAEPAAEEGAE